MNTRLALKVAENRERREKEVLLASLPKAWVELVENEKTMPSWEFLDQFPVNPSYDLTKQPRLADKLIRFADYDDIDLAKAYLHQNEMLLQPSVLCWFGSGPAFIVGKVIATKWISELTYFNDFVLYFCESDFSRGIICSEYIGYLEQGRTTNNREIVYEVMSFDNR